jgi:hypothetical protein
MPWGKLDDSLYDHPKLDELPPAMRLACVGLWAVSISWCNRRLTDGHVPAGRIRLLGGTTQQAEALVKVRLFDKDQGGYRVHDFLDFNDSKEYVMARRAKDAIRQQAARDAKQESHGVSRAVSQRDSERTNSVTPPVSPSPARGRVPGPSSPVPALPGPTDTHAARDDDPVSEEETDLFAYLAQRGAFIRPDSPFGQRLLGLIDRRGVERVMQTAKELYTGEPLSDRQWVFGLEKALEAIPSPPMEELPVDNKPSPIFDRMMSRRLEYFRSTGTWPDEWGEKPEGLTA